MKRIPILLLAAFQGYTFTDDLGRTVTVEQPERVAALIGSFADVWCLAGGQSTLVAAAHDAWTSFDLGLSDTVADLGAVKEPNLEVLLAAQPDFILASCNTTADPPSPTSSWPAATPRRTWSWRAPLKTPASRRPTSTSRALTTI